MAFFPFGRKLDIGKDFSLEEIPVFSSLSPAEQKIIDKKARLVEYKRGDIVYAEGTESDAFYVVISGRFRLFNQARGDKPEQTLLLLYRGDHFGETSLINGHPHSVTVEAKSDGLILRLEKNDFLKLVSEMPAISLYLNRAIGHRLTMSLGGKGPRREVVISALHSKSPEGQVLLFWMDFAKALVRESKRDTILIDFIPTPHALLKEEFKSASLPVIEISKLEPTREADVKSRIVNHPEGFSYLRVDLTESTEKDEKKITSLLSFLTYRYDHLLVRLPGDITSIAYRCLKQSDLIYLYTESGIDDLEECAELVTTFEKGFGFGRNEIKILVPEETAESASVLTFDQKENYLKQRILSVIPDRLANATRYALALRFLAKEMSGNLVGLALGSGAAYGLSHIGVIKVLEKEGIKIDVVSGSSMGALVGALWAAGHPAEKLEEIAASIDKKSGFFKLLGFSDISIAHHGFFKGNGVHRFLDPYLGQKTFQDLSIPLRVVATNLFTAEQVVFRSGRVTDAIRASVSIPGIFRPYNFKGEHLIDGGVIDPLPVHVLTSMGVKKIIGVNVLPSPKDWSRRYHLEQEQMRKRIESSEKKGWKRFLGDSLDRLRQHYSGNIFNVIMNTIQFMEFEMASASGRKADVLIHPVLPDGHWAQFYYPHKFIKAGEDAAREQLPEIRRLLTE